MGLVELSVSDLDRSVAYWQHAVGLRVLSRENLPFQYLIVLGR